MTTASRRKAAYLIVEHIISDAAIFRQSRVNPALVHAHCCNCLWQKVAERVRALGWFYHGRIRGWYRPKCTRFAVTFYVILD